MKTFIIITVTLIIEFLLDVYIITFIPTLME